MYFHLNIEIKQSLNLNIESQNPFDFISSASVRLLSSCKIWSHFLPEFSIRICNICWSSSSKFAYTLFLDIKTKAEKNGGDYIINGSKMWITNAHQVYM